MEDRTKNKMKAAAKISFGIGKAVSGVLMASGHSILGSFCRSHHMVSQAAIMAREELKSARESIAEGMDDWRDA